MTEPVREVPVDLLIRANIAAAKSPRGFATISIIKALSKEVSTADLIAISYRLQALATLTRGDDVADLTMNLQLINEAAFKAAAACPLVLRGTIGDSEFDREEFLRLALMFARPEGNG
jgi:hypothetical protein